MGPIDSHIDVTYLLLSVYSSVSLADRLCVALEFLDLSIFPFVDRIQRHCEILILLVLLLFLTCAAACIIAAIVFSIWSDRLRIRNETSSVFFYLSLVNCRSIVVVYFLTCASGVTRIRSVN